MIEIKSPGHKMIPSDYYLMKRFEVMEVEKDGNLHQRLVKPGTRLRYTTIEGIFDAIHEVHAEGQKHAGRDILNKKLQTRYANVTVKQIQAFIDPCELCQTKKTKQKKGVTVKPLVTSDANRRCQVDCIDMQSMPDVNFKYIMVYQDHLTKYTCLRALATKTAEEVVTSIRDHLI